MSFDLSKVVRVRPSRPSIDERLSVTTAANGAYKGATSDIRVELYQSSRKYKIEWIPIVESSSSVKETVEYKKSDFEDYENENYFKAEASAIEKQMNSAAARRISNLGLQGVDSGTYYTIVQDPWKDEPPLKRNYGFDPYYLNNGAEITVHWYENKSGGGLVLAGGLVWSNDDGTEDDLGNTSLNKSSLIKTIEVYHKESNERLMLSDNQIKKWSLDYKDQNFTGNISDIDIIETFISKWMSTVPNYELKICTPNYYPSSITLEYISPINTIPETTPTSTDNQTPATDITGDKKFDISVVFDKNMIIKAKQDFNGLNIYIGDPPKEGEFSFDEFTDNVLLDPEYQETKFQGDGENIVTVDEKLANEKEAESNGGTQLEMPQGSYNVSGIEPDTPFDPTKLTVPPGFNGVPLYFQYDKRWGKYNYGKGKKMECTGKGAGTIESSGCMPTSLSMMINYWAKKGYCKPTRPDVVGQFCLDYGGRICGEGGNLTLINSAKFKEIFGLNIVTFSGNITNEQVEKLLKNGFPFNHGGATTGKTAAGKDKSYGGHYLCLTGIDEQGRIRVNDPGNGPMGGKAITYYAGKWTSSNTTRRTQSYLYPDQLGNPLK